MYEDLKSYTGWVARWLLLVYFLVALVGKSPIGRDDSDPGDWGKRSGISPRIDHRTGCQYLEAANGGLTPRLDREGKHLGCR